MKVSVIMPTYNRASMLPGAVASFLEQDYENSELIILNNGSTDDTLHLLAGLSHPRIKVIHSVVNMVPPHNFNHMLQYVTGDLVCHLHDDDRLLKNGLSLRVNKFLSDPSIQVVYAGWITNGKTYIATPPDAQRIVRDEYINFLTMMFRSDLDLTLDTDFSHYYDWYFKIRCFQTYKVGHVPDPVISYTVHAGQESVKCRQLGLNAQEEQLMRQKLNDNRQG